MGKGDKRSRRGKIFSASYGNVRKRTKKKNVKPAAKTAVVAAKKAPVAKKAKEPKAS